MRASSYRSMSEGNASCMKGGNHAKMVKPAQNRNIDPAKRSCSVGDSCSRANTSCRGATVAATVADMLKSFREEVDEAAASASASWLALGSGMVSAATPAAANANTPMMRESVRHPTFMFFLVRSCIIGREDIKGKWINHFSVLAMHETLVGSTSKYCILLLLHTCSSTNVDRDATAPPTYMPVVNLEFALAKSFAAKRSANKE